MHPSVKRIQSEKLVPSLELLIPGTFKVGDLITNTASGYVWEATQFDVDTMRPDLYETHTKFRKMIPIF